MTPISTRLALATCLGLICTPAAHAAVQLIATGTLTGSSAGANVDLSVLTGPLENGLSGNILGGMGSAP